MSYPKGRSLSDTYRDTPLTPKESEEICSRMDRGVMMREDLERMVDSPDSGDQSQSAKGGTTQRQDLMALFWAAQQRQPSYLLNEDKLAFKHQMKIWRKQARKGIINIHSHNSQENTYKGRKYYSFTLVQHNPITKEQEELTDPLSLMLFGFMVSGLTYWMTSKENRDAIVSYVMKDIDEDRFT